MLIGDLLNSGEPTYVDFILFMGFFIFAVVATYLGISFIISQLFNRNPEA
jgi:hypothetical protein